MGSAIKKVLKVERSNKFLLIRNSYDLAPPYQM